MSATTTIALADLKQLDIIRVRDNRNKPYDLLVLEVEHHEDWAHVNGRVLRNGMSVGRTLNGRTVDRCNESMLDAAFRHGRDFDPDSSRAAWVDHAGREAVVAYHQGQEIRYENEEW